MVAGNSVCLVVLFGGSWLFFLPVIEAKSAYLAQRDGTYDRSTLHIPHSHADSLGSTAYHGCHCLRWMGNQPLFGTSIPKQGRYQLNVGVRKGHFLIVWKASDLTFPN
jgi:hypothetical protein